MKEKMKIKQALRSLTLSATAVVVFAGAAKSELLPVLNPGNSAVNVYNTGFDANGNQVGNFVADGNYSLTAGPNSDAQVVGSAYAILPVVGYPFSPTPYWIDTGTTSSWIGLTTTGGDGQLTAPSGNYYYSTNIDLTNFDPTTLLLAGSLITDDTLVNILVNGSVIGSYTSTVHVPTPFAIDDSSGDFIQGINQLTFEIENAGTPGQTQPDNPVGLNIQFTDAEAAATPEPGTLVLLSAALVGLGLIHKRRRSS